MKKKIIMIGPVYPYKGGISHYTGLMYRALSKKYDVYMMSYKMQYPKLLFHQEQYDYSNDTFRLENTDYYIHTANPINWINTATHIQNIGPEFIIIQWWHPYFAPCYWCICKLLKNIKIIFLCHNVFPHERFPMDHFLAKCVLKMGNYFIVQSSTDEENLKTIIPEAKYIKTVHPTYNAFKLLNLSKDESRKLLHITDKEKVLLFFGFIREYKGLKHLLHAMPVVKDNLSDVKLLIVGDFNGKKDYYLKIMEDLDICDYIEIYDDYIPDKEVEKFFAASDLVVLPYESATQSGIVQISYGFTKPVIATDVGGLPEVVLNGKTGYIAESKNSIDLANQIIRFFAENKADIFQKEIKKEAYRFSWDRMVEIVEDLCERR